MLSVQRSSTMGSSQAPNQSGPFGYSFNGNSIYPFPSPPEPAPGTALLDDSESQFINSFLDGVNSDQYTADFFNTGTDVLDNGDFTWGDLPPTFMGTSTSLGHPLNHTNGTVPGMLFPDVSNGNMGLLPPSNHQTTTEADIRAAASLMQNGHNHANISHHFPTNVPLFDQTRPAHIPTPQISRQAREPAMSYDQSRLKTTPMKNNGWAGDSFYAEMMYGSEAASGTRPPRSPAKAADIQWGTDNSFGTQNFVATASQKGEVAAAEQNMLSILGQFEPQSSTAASTRPSSPVVSRYIDSASRHIDPDTHDRDYIDEEDRPAKRRKSHKMKVENDIEDDVGISTITPKKRRQKSVSVARPTSSSTTQSPPPSKRRKSLASATKANRENLTEDQKRENHIKSEQKRRTLIKEGFDDLGELVPDLKGGGHSKSAVLIMAADWLEDLIKGNEELRRRIRAMDKDLKGF